MFVARSSELAQLQESYDSGSFQMVVVYGRRRVGKSTLLRQFCADKSRVHFFTARETTPEENLARLSAAILVDGLDMPGDISPDRLPSYQSFEAAIASAFAQAEGTRSVLVIDEYPYLAQSYPGISSLLQEHIDRQKDDSSLMLVLCGSSMSFMEHQVLGRQSPLYGRRTAQLKVEPFDCVDARQMLSGASPQRVVELYSLVGGVPLYLEQLDATKTTEWNLAHRMLGLGCFLYAEPEAFLLQEVRSPALYNAIIEAIARGCTRPVDIENACHIKSSAVASYLKALVELGIVGKVQPVGSRRKSDVRYRIEDKLFRFWHTFVPRYGQLVEMGMGERAAQRIVQRDLSTFVGHTFEDVCREWVVREMAQGSIGMLPREVGSWWGPDPYKKATAEVDVVVRGIDGELLVGECKWEASPVSSDVIGRLAHRAELIDAEAREIRLMVFSRSGFTEECEREAKRRGNVRLVAADEML